MADPTTLSGQYGELKEQLLEAVQAIDLHYISEHPSTPNTGRNYTRRAIERAWPLIVATLEAQAYEIELRERTIRDKDREIVLVRKLLEENRTAVDIYGEQLEAKDREVKEVFADAEEFATLSRQAEQREAEARRLLRVASAYPWLRCCTHEWGGPHAVDCTWMAAKNFLESKP